MNTHHFHDLRFQLSFSNSKLRVVNYYVFRSQNNSDGLLTKRYDHLNAELVKNLFAANLIQVIPTFLECFFRGHNKMGLNFEQSV